MITDDKTITQVSYWDKIYSGKNNNAKVDASNTKRVSTFDRFDVVVKHAEGPRILGIGSGHARIESKIKALHNDWFIVASDQSDEARKVSGYLPYLIIDAYKLPYHKKAFDLIIATQMLEYLERPEEFLNEAKRVSKKFLCTVPKGIMSAWSQLREYTEENTRQFFEQYGIIEVYKVYEHLILVKIKFND